MHLILSNDILQIGLFLWPIIDSDMDLVQLVKLFITENIQYKNKIFAYI